jgi:hypothetical protein
VFAGLADDGNVFFDFFASDSSGSLDLRHWTQRGDEPPTTSRPAHQSPPASPPDVHIPIPFLRSQEYFGKEILIANDINQYIPRKTTEPNCSDDSPAELH